MADLNAASLEDVKNWFRTWYGPNNAVLVLAGDIDLATAKEKVTKYFGDIPATPTMAQPKIDVAKHDASTRETMTDKVPQARIYRVWNIAEYGQRDVDRLQLLAQVLGGSKSSRLDTRLVHEDKLADNVSAQVSAVAAGLEFHHHRRRQAGRRSGQGRGDHRRGAVEAARGRPDRGRNRTGTHRVQGQRDPRHRAHRRLRRQGRRAGRMHDLHRQPGLLPRQPQDLRHRHRRRAAGRRQAVARERRPHPGGAAGHAPGRSPRMRRSRRRR